MSWLSSLFGGGETVQPTATFLQNPQYSGAAPAINQGWSYLSNGLQALQEGKPPTWFQNWRPLEEAQRKNALTGTYYGQGAGAQGGNMFGPGVLATQRSADVRAGRRGAGAGSNYAKQLDMYSQGMSDIDNYLSKLGYEAMNTAEGRYLGGLSSIPQGPQGQWTTSPGYYQPSAGETIMQGIGNLAPYAIGAAIGQPWLGAAAGGMLNSATFPGYDYKQNYAQNPYGEKYGMTNIVQNYLSQMGLD